MEVSHLWDETDDRWADAVRQINESVAKLNETITQQIEALGFNPSFVPSVGGAPSPRRGTMLGNV